MFCVGDRETAPRNAVDQQLMIVFLHTSKSCLSSPVGKNAAQPRAATFFSTDQPCAQAGLARGAWTAVMGCGGAENQRASRWTCVMDARDAMMGMHLAAGVVRRGGEEREERPRDRGGLEDSHRHTR